MALELPALSAVVARMADPTIHLAAYGGVVFPVALIIEAPIIMLLAASTALSRDWATYNTLKRYMMTAGAILTGVHILLAFTPLFDSVVAQLLDPPPEIIEPARLGFQIMTPWTWAIAYRRFHQGVLIRFGHSQAVSVGTLIRLSADGLVLGLGYFFTRLPGIAVATSAVAAGVLSEASYAGWRVIPVLRDQVRPAQQQKVTLTFNRFLPFYVLLALTSLLTLLIQPLGAAAISRMPMALESLAVWPVVAGLIFLFRSLGMAYNEVVVALADLPHATHFLHRFAFLLMGSTTLLLLLMASTPLAAIWFEEISALSPALSELSRIALWFALPLPAMNVLQSWYQGILVNQHRTRGVTEAVLVFLISSAIILITGVLWGQATGLNVGLGAFSFSAILQAIWLYHRSRPVIAKLLAT